MHIDELDSLERGSQLLDREKTGHGLVFAMADDLEELGDDDEIVENMLTASAMSVLYGDSNTGKTFVAVDLAGAVARDVPWMGRKVDGGLVIYLASEGPKSVYKRAKAYQQHHRLPLRHLAIVKSPIDLFNGEADTEAIISLVQNLEQIFKLRTRLIVGDTLARMSAGANENSGQDMGVVLRHVDRIREECGAHFLLIHHCGKNAALGMRGWSGLRAAIDTEIEVTADPVSGLHAIEITKQRDLAGKGDRTGFRLQAMEIGRNKWNNPITSCIVVPADAPAKKEGGRRRSEIAGAILELLTTRGSGMKKADIAKHFDRRYDRSAVYREMKKMIDARKLNEVSGVVAMRRGNE